jgi:hypothetical protein
MDRLNERLRMARTRNIFFHGLGITLRRLPAFLWTYVFNLALALAFSFPLYHQLSKLLDHSMASQRLSSGFDLSVIMSAAQRIHGDRIADSGAMASHGSVLVYLLVYFLLIPGTIFCYLTKTRSSLGNLLRQGLKHFWRFVRITVLFLLSGLIVLGPLSMLQRRWSDLVDDHFVGRPALLLTLAGILIVLLAASLLRLYFDLVEVYTVQLGTHKRFSGRSDRRVRKTLVPAFRLLRKHLFRAWLVFLLLAILGGVVAFLTTRMAMHMLAQSHVWPMFLVAQFGLFVMLFMRFWQRGVETSLVLQNPISPEPETPVALEPYGYNPPPPAPAPHPDDRPHHVEMIYNTDPLSPVYPPPFSPNDPVSSASTPLETRTAPSDPIPNPEPASPSLDEPDPGVFHHDPLPPGSSGPDRDKT